MPASPTDRAEIRRLVAWFLGKLDSEVTGYLVNEKVFKRHLKSPRAAGRRTPPPSARPGATSVIICAISAT